MSFFRRFQATDLLKINYVNLDRYTENYNISFYLNYFLRWPQYNEIAFSVDGRPIGYIMGKCEGEGKNWHGHVTALTVAPEYRRLGIGQRLMRGLEETSEAGKMYFVDLFVRPSNSKATMMYEKLGYSMYRRILDYYTGVMPEDALDMRKALTRDKKKESIIPLKHPISVEELYYSMQ